VISTRSVFRSLGCSRRPLICRCRNSWQRSTAWRSVFRDSSSSPSFRSRRCSPLPIEQFRQQLRSEVINGQFAPVNGDLLDYVAKCYLKERQADENDEILKARLNRPRLPCAARPQFARRPRYRHGAVGHAEFAARADGSHEEGSP